MAAAGGPRNLVLLSQGSHLPASLVALQPALQPVLGARLACSGTGAPLLCMRSTISPSHPRTGRAPLHALDFSEIRRGFQTLTV